MSDNLQLPLPWMGCPWLAEDRRQGPRRGDCCGVPSRQVQLHTGNKRVKPFAASVLAVLILALLALSASAASFSPLQIGILGDKCQLVSPETPVIGLRLNLPRSYNETVAGIDFGLLSDDTTTFSGLRLNAISFSQACNGIAIALFDMAVHLKGIQVAPIAVANNACGLQIGLGTDAEELHGIQIGVFNGTRTVSCSPTVRGLQLGLLNYASSLRGVQIGLLNFDTSSSWPCLPLLRVSL